MHISASVFINDDETGLHHDYEQWLEKLAPHEPVSQYRHNVTGEDNADSHPKRQIMGREVVVAITNGKLDFGPWEQNRGCTCLHWRSLPAKLSGRRDLDDAREYARWEHSSSKL